MAVVVLVMGCMVGFLGAAIHVVAFGAGLTQGAITYFAVSIGSAGTLATGAWAMRARSAKPSQPPRQRSFEDQLEDWMDWQMQEDIDDAAKRASMGASMDQADTRKSA